MRHTISTTASEPYDATVAVGRRTLAEKGFVAGVVFGEPAGSARQRLNAARETLGSDC